MEHKLNVKRLEKLINFLDQLVPKKFDFSSVVTEVDSAEECGTVCCAMGWTPVVFPDLVKWCEKGYDIELVDSKYSRLGYYYVAHRLFGVSTLTALFLFSPNTQSMIHPSLSSCGRSATPKQVADMLRKFVKLVKRKEITGLQLE